MLRARKQGKSDNIDLDELEECLKSLGFSPQMEDVVFLRKHFDDNQDGQLSIGELMDNLDVLNYHFYYGKPLMNAFLSIDKDGDGVIRYPEMLHVLMTKGERPLPPKEARELLNEMATEFDTNFDGKFSYAGYYYRGRSSSFGRLSRDLEFVKIYMSDILPFKSELNRRQMLQNDTDTVDYVANSMGRNKHNRLEGSSDTKWNLVREKLDNVTEHGAGASNHRKSSNASSGGGKPRRNSNVKEGVVLYSRKNRRQSWAS